METYETPLDPPLIPGEQERKKRGNYVKYTPEHRASIGRYALENGNERARRNFQYFFPNVQ